MFAQNVYHLTSFIYRARAVSAVGLLKGWIKRWIFLLMAYTEFLLASVETFANLKNPFRNPLQRAYYGVQKAACYSITCSMLWDFLHPIRSRQRKKTTNDGARTPDRNYDGAFGTHSKIRMILQNPAMSLYLVFSSTEQTKTLKTSGACTESTDFFLKVFNYCTIFIC